MEGHSSSTRNLFLKVILPVAVIILTVVGGLELLKKQVSNFNSGEGAVRGELGQGSILPNFELEKFNGGKLHVSDLKTKVALVNFWATWCEACMVEMPSLLKLRDLYKNRGFELIAINVDENPTVILPRTLQQLGIDFTVYIDPEGQLAQTFDVHAIPLTVIMDRDRKVLLLESGERDWVGSEIRGLLDQWLAK